MMAPYSRVILRMAEVRSRETTLKTLRALNSISSQFLKASLAKPKRFISTKPWSYIIYSSSSPEVSTIISNRQESLSINFYAYDLFKEVEVKPKSSMQLPIQRLAASLFLSLAPRQVTILLDLCPTSLRYLRQQCLIAWQVQLKGMVQGLNSSELWERRSMELVRAQQKVQRTQKFIISLDFFSLLSSVWSIFLYSYRWASSLGTYAYLISTMSVNSLRYPSLSFFSFSLRAPQRQRRQEVTSVVSYPVRRMKLGNLSFVLSFSSSESTITNLASFSISPAACSAAFLISMNIPLIFLLARLSSNDLLMPASFFGLQRQIAMMFLWFYESSIRVSELQMSATTLKKQLWIFRNFSACSQVRQMGTSQSFYMCDLQIFLIQFMLPSSIVGLRMNSQMKEALPERNPLTISMFLSLSLLSLSLKILLSSSLVCSPLFLSLGRWPYTLCLESEESISRLIDKLSGLGLLPPMQSQSDYSRQLFLLGMMFML